MKFIVVSLILIILLAMCSCGSSNDTFSDPSQEFYFSYAAAQDVVAACPEQAENLQTAVNFWNDAVGEEVLRIGAEGFPLECIDDLGSNLGVASVNLEHSTCNYIFVHPLANEFVIAHELGHCVGLAHSRDPRSLMYTLALPSSRNLSEEIYAHFERDE